MTEDSPLLHFYNILRNYSMSNVKTWSQISLILKEQVVLK